jgi:hypothetical protein
MFGELMMCTIVTALLGDLVMLPALMKVGWPNSLLPHQLKAAPSSPPAGEPAG